MHRTVCDSCDSHAFDNFILAALRKAFCRRVQPDFVGKCRLQASHDEAPAMASAPAALKLAALRPPRPRDLP